GYDLGVSHFRNGSEGDMSGSPPDVRSSLQAEQIMSTHPSLAVVVSDHKAQPLAVVAARGLAVMFVKSVLDRVDFPWRQVMARQHSWVGHLSHSVTCLASPSNRQGVKPSR